MTIQDPTIFSVNAKPLSGVRESEEWVERKIGEFTLQTKLPCFHNETTGEWFVSSHHWDAWDTDLVAYFISKGYTSPEIDAFIQEHALGGGQ